MTSHIEDHKRLEALKQVKQNMRNFIVIGFKRKDKAFVEGEFAVLESFATPTNSNANKIFKETIKVNKDKFVGFSIYENARVAW